MVEFTQGSWFWEPGRKGDYCSARYEINTDVTTAKVVVHGDEWMRDQILAFLNSDGFVAVDRRRAEGGGRRCIRDRRSPVTN